MEQCSFKQCYLTLTTIFLLSFYQEVKGQKPSITQSNVHHPPHYIRVHLIPRPRLSHVIITLNSFYYYIRDRSDALKHDFKKHIISLSSYLRCRKAETLEMKSQISKSRQDKEGFRDTAFIQQRWNKHQHVLSVQTPSTELKK